MVVPLAFLGPLLVVKSTPERCQHHRALNQLAVAVTGTRNDTELGGSTAQQGLPSNGNVLFMQHICETPPITAVRRAHCHNLKIPVGLTLTSKCNPLTIGAEGWGHIAPQSRKQPARDKSWELVIHCCHSAQPAAVQLHCHDAACTHLVGGCASPTNLRANK